MPLFTLKHCLICYKEDNSTDNQQDISSAKALNKKTEICRRFCTLASRYLDLDPYHFNPTKTITSKTIISYERACDNCIEVLLSFCEIYQQCEYLKLQLSWRAYEISQTMRHADKNNGDHRRSLKEKLLTMESTMEEIDDFRTDFMSSIDLKRKQASPTVEINHEEAEEDPDFIEIKVPVSQSSKDKKNIVTDAKNEKCIKKGSKDLSMTTNRTRRHSERINVSTNATRSLTTTTRPCNGVDSAQSSTNSREQLSDYKNSPKRLKISLKNKQPVDTLKLDLNSSLDSSGNELISDNTLDDYHNTDCSRRILDNPVTISNDKTNVNLVSTFKDISYQYQDNLLNRIGEDKATVDDPLNSQEAGDAFLDCAVTSDMFLSSKPNKIVSSNYYQQFDHLQYTCPFLKCGKVFNTMTRMMVHQKATGHNLNAVITITSK